MLEELDDARDGKRRLTSCRHGSGPTWRRAAAHGAPAVLAALIPKCPLCWLGYASILGAAGVAPVTWRWAPAFVASMLALSLLALALTGRGRTPLTMAALGAAILILGLKSPWALLGAPLLVVAAVWPRPVAA